jgi:hypothetical protein
MMLPTSLYTRRADANCAGFRAFRFRFQDLWTLFDPPHGIHFGIFQPERPPETQSWRGAFDLVRGASRRSDAGMDPWAPINGISLERYAELSADLAGENDKEKQAAIVGGLGVARADWEAASAGWQARMQDPSLMGAVATRYWPLYNAAVARKGAAGHPPPVGYPPAAAGHPPPAGGYPPPNAYPQQAYYNAQAQNAGAQIGSAFNAFGNALGSFVDGAVGAFAIGSRVMVQWSDGQRYPATVAQPPQAGQIEVAFPDGRRVWVPQGVVSAIY